MVTVRAEQIATTTTEATVRQHKIIVDRPEAIGGTDAGPMGGELLLVSLAGCFLSNVYAAIIARDADIRNVKVEVIGEMADAPSRYQSITMKVAADYTDRDLMEKIILISERACIVANTLKQGFPVTVTIVEALDS